jgi:uncharacterized membrane protein
VVQQSRGGQERPEDDESSEREDNSLGRLLTLSDGVFAIAMTLLAFNLAVPDLGSHPSDATLRHALAHNSASYLSFLVSFYVIANYWHRHRRLMRFVVTTHPRLIRDTMLLLLIVAAIPFLASLLGHYGGTPFALALYGAFNALATLTLLQIARDVRRFKLVGHHARVSGETPSRWAAVNNLAVFLLCIPAGYALGSNGPWVLVLLAAPLGLPLLRRLRRRRPTRRSAEPSSVLASARHHGG